MIFFEDDNCFSLETASLKSAGEISKGIWLVLVGIHETPPHIALLNEGKYYSLSARKADCGTPLERFMNALSRRNIPCLFIRIEMKNEGSNNVIARNEAISVNLLQKIYKDLQPLYNNGNTCLSPIKIFFTEYYSAEFATVNYVFELLSLAEKKGLIKKCIPLYGENTGTNLITLPKYTMAQIQNKIRLLLSPITINK